MPKSIPLGEAAVTVDYGVTASATDSPIGPKFLRITDIQDGSVNWDSVPWCECDAKTASGSMLASGDIVFARTGATTGKSYLIRECPENSVFASYLIRVRVNNDFDPRYVSHFFQTPNYWAQITKSARGVAQPGVNATTLKSLSIPVFPLSEQKRIAEILDRAEALRAKRRAALALLDELTQSIFLDMFGDPVSNPKGFQWGTMSNLFAVKHGFAFKSEYFCDSADHVLLTPGNFNETGGYRDRGEKTKFYSGPIPNGYVLQQDDMLVAMTEQAPGLLGSPLFVPKSGVYLHNQRLGLVELKASANKNFVFELLNTRAVRLAIQSSSTGTKVKHTSPAKLTAVRVPIPPINLQQRFASIVNQLETVKSIGRSALVENSMLFSSLQHQAFRGEL